MPATIDRATPDRATNDRTTSEDLSSLALRSERGRVVIEGYAARYDELSRELAPGVKELLLPGSLDEALRDGYDTVALFDHDTSKLLGRRSAGTLRLRSDDRGLWVEIDVPDTSAARDALTSIRRGDVVGQSVRIRGVSDRWESRDGFYVSIIERVREIVDVGPVTLPAYGGTSIAERLRSLEAWRCDQAAAERAALRARLEALS